MYIILLVIILCIFLYIYKNYDNILCFLNIEKYNKNKHFIKHTKKANKKVNFDFIDDTDAQSQNTHMSNNTDMTLDTNASYGSFDINNNKDDEFTFSS
jgi:hypothetical protein